MRLLVLMLVGCCPVTVWDPYPMLESGEHVGCSWGVLPSGRIATAAHCLAGGAAWFEGAPGKLAETTLIDTETDYAEVAGEHPSGAREFTVARPPRLGEVACYYDFRGEPNCGYVVWVSAYACGLVFESRLVIPGDSGSPLEGQSDDAFLGVVTEKALGVFGRAARP